ncbi:MAG: type 2 isopentenyl-diphosphate Delta-isomerase [Bellilinea sp.]
MDDPLGLRNRKTEHIRINLEEDVRSGLTTGLEKLHFINQALPDIDLSSVDPSITIFNKRLSAPLIISSMTGGTTEAGQINLRLAETAQEKSIAMGLGSQRAAIEDSETGKSFEVRRVAPDILLFANLGAVQLNYGYTIDHCRRAVEMVAADGLFLHLNALQEALQPEGDTRFSGLLRKIEKICRQLPVPVVVKEVGWGISGETARSLADAGVAAIDVAGAGGTSWSQVEMHRMKNPRRAAIAAAFQDWGIPTAESIRQVHQAVPELLLFASGGLRSGVDAAKTIALGASLAGMAGPFLKAAASSPEAAADLTDDIINEIRIAMFAAGAQDIDKLGQLPLVKF